MIKNVCTKRLLELLITNYQDYIKKEEYAEAFFFALQKLRKESFSNYVINEAILELRNITNIHFNIFWFSDNKMSYMQDRYSREIVCYNLFTNHTFMEAPELIDYNPLLYYETKGKDPKREYLPQYIDDLRRVPDKAGFFIRLDNSKTNPSNTWIRLTYKT